ncbi:vWA domain-containing protein [Actinopolymorpha alba]|uniref:vWA domain-containing protein n=1 Tax=Actinopolymorpha alba TaxID=533267 RepID=UPI0006880CA7|nr:VWA domain-containing protein [Actinopolymorpha alba]
MRWWGARVGRGRRVFVAGILAVSALLGAACSTSEEKNVSTGPGKAGELRVLAGSELADLEPILTEAAKKTGVTVRFTFAGTLDGVQQVIDGTTRDRYDAIWFSSNRYLSLHPESAGKTATETKVMTSPVVLGLAASKAKELGWSSGAQVTWADVAEAAGAGKFTYGMTNPASSNSGFSALVGVAAALAGTGAALEQPDVDKVAPQLEKFFSAQKLTAGSSGWLSDAYAERSTGKQSGTKVDGIVNYESVLLSLNASGRLPEPLTLIYPSDGVVTADYPLTLLSSATDQVAEGYRALVGYLRSPDVQREIMVRTHRRPAIPQVKVDKAFGPASLVELPFPAKLGVADGLINTYFDKLRRPARTIYVLDVSGSMSGDRIESLRNALVKLTGADDTVAGKFQRFHGREEVTLLPFSSSPESPQTFTVPEKSPDTALADIRAAAMALESGGGTAVYDSVLQAYDQLKSESQGDYATSIVLMTDGENTTGSRLDGFKQAHSTFPPRLRQIPIFTILFGEGSTDEMNQLATLTGGRSFDAREGSLESAFQEIRGYQ